MLNRAILMGYLGRAPSLTYTPDGTPVARFTLASTFHWTDAAGENRKTTEWSNIEAWGSLAEACYEYLDKGRLVLVEGRLRTDRWQAEGINQRRTFVVANDVRFVPTGKPAPVKAFEIEDLPEIIPAKVEAIKEVEEKPRRNGRKKQSAVEA